MNSSRGMGVWGQRFSLIFFMANNSAEATEPIRKAYQLSWCCDARVRRVMSCLMGAPVPVFTPQ